MLIEIFSDLICPWCYIGTRRLNRALGERPHLRSERRWHPFLLNPELPHAGIDRSVYLAVRFGGGERARQVLAVVEDTARRDGLPLNLDRITRTPNTLDAHRLVMLAQSSGGDAGDRLVDALFASYFVDGLDIGDRDLLVVLAATVGLDPTEARATLENDGQHELVLFHAEVLARQLDLHAVPCFVFDRRYVLSGAQEPVTFLPLLDIAAQG